MHWICVANIDCFKSTIFFPFSKDIFGFAVSPGLTKILPIEKCIFF